MVQMINMMDYKLIDSLDASVYWKDLSGKYLGCNKYMEKMAGLSRNQIIGNTDYFLPWKDQAHIFQQIDRLVIDKCEKYEVEERPLINNGTYKTYLSSKSPLINENGKIIGIIGVSIDVTDNKKFKQDEEVIDKNQNSSEFLKNKNNNTEYIISNTN